MSGREGSAAEEQPTRCWLVPWSTLERASYSQAVTGNFKPSLAIDIDKDTISVLDLDTNALVVSAPLAQVTATPAKHERKYPRIGVITLPVLVVSIVGMRRLTIGCMEPKQAFGAAGYRFSWRGRVLAEGEPAYVVAGAGWLTLVEKLGLATQLQDSEPASSGPASSGATAASQGANHREQPPAPLYAQSRTARFMRSMMIGWLVFCLAFMGVAVILGVVFHHL